MSPCCACPICWIGTATDRTVVMKRKRVRRVGVCILCTVMGYKVWYLRMGR